MSFYQSFGGSLNQQNSSSGNNGLMETSMEPGSGQANQGDNTTIASKDQQASSLFDRLGKAAASFPFQLSRESITSKTSTQPLSPTKPSSTSSLVSTFIPTLAPPPSSRKSLDVPNLLHEAPPPDLLTDLSDTRTSIDGSVTITPLPPSRPESVASMSGSLDLLTGGNSTESTLPPPLIPQSPRRSSLNPRSSVDSATAPLVNPQPPQETKSVDSEEKIARLKKMESKFTDLAKAFKIVKAKQDHLESLFKTYTPSCYKNNSLDVKELERYLSDSSSNLKAGEEVQALAKKLNDLKQQHETEAATQADMYGVMQKRLFEREEEINKLKRKMNRLENGQSPGDTGGTSTPVINADSVSSPATTSFSTVPADTLSLKLKIRELTSALKTAQEQRQKALDRVKQIERGSVTSTTGPVGSSTDTNMSISSPTLARDSLSLSVPPSPIQGNKILEPEELIKARDRILTLETQHSQLQTLHQDLQLKSDKEANASASAKRMLKNLRDECDTSQEKIRQLQEASRSSESKFEQLKMQMEALKSETTKISEERDSLRDETIDLKMKVTELEASDHLQIIERLKQEGREKLAGWENRVRTVQRRLEDVESTNTKLKTETSLQKAKIESLEKEKSTKEANVSKLEATIESLKKQIQVLTKEAKEAQGKVDEAALKQAEKSLAETKADCDQLKKACDDLKAEMEKRLKDQTVSWESKLKSKETELESLKNKLKVTSESLEKEKKIQLDLESQLKIQESKYTSLQEEHEGEIESAKSSAVKDMESKLSAKDMIIQTAKAALSESQKNVQNASAELASLKTSHRQAIDTLEHQLEQLKEELEKKETSVKHAQTNIDNLKKQLQETSPQGLDASLKVELEAKVEELSQAVKDSEGRLEKVRHDVAESLSKAQSLETEKVNLEAEVRLLKRTIQSNEEALSAKEKEHIVALASNETMKAEITSLKEQHKTALAKLKEGSDAAIASFSAEKKTMADKIEAMEKQLSKLEELAAEKEHLVNVRADLEAEREKLAERVASLDAELTSAKNSIQKLKVQVAEGAISEETQRKLERLEEEKQTLAEQIQVLETKVQELETNATTTAEGAESTTSQLKEMEEEKVVLSERIVELEAELAIAQSSIGEKEDALLAIQNQLSSVKQALSDEEEKKTKSIQLLRSSKTRILKLESDLRAKQEELTKATNTFTSQKQTAEKELSEKSTLLETLQKQAVELTVQAKKVPGLIQETEALKAQLVSSQVSLQKERQMREELESELSSKLSESSNQVVPLQEELDLVKSKNDRLEEELNQWPLRMQEAESRIEVLDADLEMSKKHFQTKSIENDALKIRISELEAQSFHVSQASEKTADEIEQLRFDASQVRKELQDRVQQIKKLEHDLFEFKSQISDLESQIEFKTAELDACVSELKIVRSEYTTYKSVHESSESRFTDLESTISNLKDTLKEVKSDRDKARSDIEVVMNDFKIRETQLKNLNKSLKDEVRKLARGSSTASSAETSPTFPRRNRGSLSESINMSPRTSISSMNGDTSKPPVATTSISTDRKLQGGLLSPINATNPFSPPGGRPSSAFGLTSPNPLSAGDPVARPSTSYGRRNSRDVPLPDPDPTYLKHVILKFIETKDKRAQLVNVIGMLLKFTPDEIRRAQKSA